MVLLSTLICVPFAFYLFLTKLKYRKDMTCSEIPILRKQKVLVTRTRGNLGGDMSKKTRIPTIEMHVYTFDTMTKKIYAEGEYIESIEVEEPAEVSNLAWEYCD